MPSYCYNCGEQCVYDTTYPIDEPLQQTWKLSSQLKDIFNLREGLICSNCGVNVRAQGLARAIVESKFGFGVANLKEWVKLANKNKLKLLELNSCHELHKTFLGLKGLTYSEYGTESEQNIEKLTYDSNEFDIIVHSETLEHVSDPIRAMNECRRVLNHEGIILFTTPVIWNRITKRRARIINNKIQKILPASYHGRRSDDYLVFFEYGIDIDKYVGSDIAIEDLPNQNFVFVSGKEPRKITMSNKIKLFSNQVKLSLRRN